VPLNHATSDNNESPLDNRFIPRSHRLGGKARAVADTERWRSQRNHELLLTIRTTHPRPLTLGSCCTSSRSMCTPGRSPSETRRCLSRGDGSRKKGVASCFCTWLRKWPERGLVERRQATNPAGRGLGLTTLRKVTTATREVAQIRILPTLKWGCRG